MSEQPRDSAEAQSGDDMTDPDEFGSLSVEDDPEGTVNPADVAGTAGPEDDT